MSRPRGLLIRKPTGAHKAPVTQNSLTNYSLWLGTLVLSTILWGCALCAPHNGIKTVLCAIFLRGNNALPWCQNHWSKTKWSRTSVCCFAKQNGNACLTAALPHSCKTALLLRGKQTFALSAKFDDVIMAKCHDRRRQLCCLQAEHLMLHYIKAL